MTSPLTRWRLVLGRFAQDSLPDGLDARQARMDQVLDFLYSDSKRAASIAHIFSFGEFVVPIQFAATDFPSDVEKANGLLARL